jgi:acetyltransferase-like isoleucine patch superfamily enzyme
MNLPDDIILLSAAHPPIECASIVWGNRVLLGAYVVLGQPKDSRLEDWQVSANACASEPEPLSIGDSCRIASHSIIGEGTSLGSGVVLEEHSRVGYGCDIGAGTRVMYRAQVCDRVTIGRDCRIGGFLGDASVVGRHVSIFGSLVHDYRAPHGGWDIHEPSPVINDYSVIGMGAVVIGGVTVGPNSYVAAGAVVTRDVPPRTMVTGLDQHRSGPDFDGRMLEKSYWAWVQRGSVE